jgi:hypothetical protein
VEADVLLGRLRIRQGKSEAGTEALVSAFTKFREHPWARRLAMKRAMSLALAVGKSNPALARRLCDSLRLPFAACSQNEPRQDTLVQMATYANDLPTMVTALEQYEPYAPWKGEYLISRASAYKAAGHKLQGRALRDLNEYRRWQGEAVLDDVMAAAASVEEKNKGTAMIEK